MFLLAAILCVTMLPVNVLAVKEEINGNYKLIALTFDDGPSKYTSELLDGLAVRGAKATFFFVLVPTLSAIPDLLKRIASEGHQLANHTYSHKQLTKLSAADMENEINGCRNLLVAAGGENTYYIRPPYGSYNDTLKSVAGAPLVLWSVDPEDWKYRDADVVTNNIMSTVKDGDIILLHDLYKTSVEAAIQVVDKAPGGGL